MYDEINHADKVFESIDGDKYWAVDGANYIEGTGTVVLNCLDSDGEETATSFTRVEAMGLAISVAMAAGIRNPTIALMKEGLDYFKLATLLKDFSAKDRADMNLMCLCKYGVQLTDPRLDAEFIKSVITEYQKDEEWKN